MLGDFNFRVEQPFEAAIQIMKKLAKLKENKEGQEAYFHLLAKYRDCDEFTKFHHLKLILSQLLEKEIDFMPTYKYSLTGEFYDETK